MTQKKIYQILTILIALVWLINGLFCKLLNLVPRHQEIVGQILGETYARPITGLIGIGEIMIGLIVLIRFMPRMTALMQMLLVATMNILEFLLVPDLLLWGKFNTIFALGFIFLVYYHEFVLRKKLS